MMVNGRARRAAHSNGGKPLMALPVPQQGMVLLVTLHGSLFNQMILNTFNYQVGTVGTEGSIQQLANNLNTSLTAAGGLVPAILAVHPPQYNLLEIWIQVIFPTRYRKFVYANGSAGVNPNNTLVTNLAVTVTRVGDQANKHNRGSLHMVQP